MRRYPGRKRSRPLARWLLGRRRAFRSTRRRGPDGRSGLTSTLNRSAAMLPIATTSKICRLRRAISRVIVLCAAIPTLGTACAPRSIEGGGPVGQRFRIDNVYGWTVFQRDDRGRAKERQDKLLVRPDRPQISCSLSAPKGFTRTRRTPAMVYVTETSFPPLYVTLADYMEFFEHCGLTVSAVDVGQASGFRIQGAGGPIATGLPGYVSDVFLIPSGNKVVRIDCAATPERYGEFKPKFQSILATFQWLPGGLRLPGQSQERKLQVQLAAWFAGSGALFGVVAFIFHFAAINSSCREKLPALRWHVIGMLVMVLSFGAAAAFFVFFPDDWDFRGRLAAPLALCVFLGTFTIESSKALLRIRRINRRLWSPS